MIKHQSRKKTKPLQGKYKVLTDNDGIADGMWVTREIITCSVCNYHMLYYLDKCPQCGCKLSGVDYY